MGIERSVTLWYLHRNLMLNELALLEAKLVQAPAASCAEAAQPETEGGEGHREGADEADRGRRDSDLPLSLRSSTPRHLDAPQAMSADRGVDDGLVPSAPSRSPSPTECLEVEEQCKRVQEALRKLGPCPKPLMG